FQGIENGMGIGGGSSRLGFMGEEALGNGLKAIFKFEWGLNIDEGSGPTGTRYTYVGLAGKWGDVTLGRDGTPSDYYMGATGPFLGVINANDPISRYRGSADILDGVRWNNSVSYHSPNFSGLTFMGIYSFGEKVSGAERRNNNGQKIGYGNNDSCTTAPILNSTTGAVVTPGLPAYCESADTSDAGKFGLGVKYANGPLYLAAMYHYQADDDSVQAWQDPNPNNNAGEGAKGWGIGGSYDFKVVKLYANYFRAKANSSDGSAALTTSSTSPNASNGGANLNKKTVWSIGVSAPVSANGSVMVEYAQLKQYSRIDAYEGKSKGYGLGYQHKLSKRTSLYGYVSSFKNDEEVNAGWSKTSLQDERQTNFSLGILHVF
ncbi:MAG: porin, partial [Candidatus Accumulibacter sp.]|nr:porin [Accumulibacter sp.]